MVDASEERLSGALGLTPRMVIQAYSAEDWEAFIEEWAEGFDPPYVQVVPLAGAGDKGRDIVGYLGDPTNPATEWDNYQCKHYDHPLTPTDVYVELAKLCVYTFRQEHTVPRRYRFVAPRGVGPKLHDLLKKPEELKKQLLTHWDTHCRQKISAAEEVSLDEALRAYVEAFDFSRVWFVTPTEILTQHSRTRYWHRRFRIEPPVRPPDPPIPDEVQIHELMYTTRLFEAYGERLNAAVTTLDDLAGSGELADHFRRSRGYFFSAEALARFSRDHFAPGAFDEIKRHVYDGVVDVVQARHVDGYECVLQVTQAATALALPHSDLVPYLSPADKKGVCHHLSNDGELRWVHR